MRFDAPLEDIDGIKESEDEDIVVETCIVRTLPPALTLEYGLDSIKEAVDKLKLDPPGSTSGVLRFQVRITVPFDKLPYLLCKNHTH